MKSDWERHDLSLCSAWEFFLKEILLFFFGANDDFHQVTLRLNHVHMSVTDISLDMVKKAQESNMNLKKFFHKYRRELQSAAEKKIKSFVTKRVPDQ